MSWLAPFYTVIKAFHIISVVAWMAGLLYLPRLFVYHADEKAGSPTAETFKTMERRLLRGIMNPAMAAVFVFGVLSAMTPGVVDWASIWIYAKLVLVAGLRGVLHGVLVAALGVLGRLALGAVVLELSLGPRRDDDVEAQRVAEGERRRPQLFPRRRRQERPQVAQDTLVRGRPLEDNLSAVEQGLRPAEQRGTVGHVDHLADLRHRSPLCGRLGAGQRRQHVAAAPGRWHALGEGKRVAAEMTVEIGRQHHDWTLRL